MPIEFKTEKNPIEYPAALAFMEKRVADIIAGNAAEMVWLLEHPPLYTAGTSSDKNDLLDKNKFPVYEAGRGGEYTYHGPGQRVAYVMLDLKKRQATDVKKYVWNLEELIIKTLAGFGVEGGRRKGRVGIWVEEDGREEKIAAIGIRIRKWVTFHGIAINIDPDLSHFTGIVPCGIKEYGVTSLKKLGTKISMPEVDAALRNNFSEVFGEENK